MFVRKKKNKSGSVSIQIVNKVNRSNKVLKTVGSSSDPAQIERLYQAALYQMPRLYGATLFDRFDEPAISELGNDSIRIIGPELIFGSIYDKVGYSCIKEPLLRDLVISRITHPGSKLKLSEYLRDTSKKAVSVYSIYRFLDKINSKFKLEIEAISYSHTQKLLGQKIGFVFYDMTTIYFESSQPDDFRITGFSKDGKHQHPQILLGLLIGKNGYPIGYEIFEGNTFEGHTLIPVLERFSKRFVLEKPIVVADAGLLSKDNTTSLRDHGYEFILGARIKNETQEVIKKIEAFDLSDGQIGLIQVNKQTKLYISYSDKRAKKDRFNRERGLKRLEKNLSSGRLTKSSINNRGYNKYLQMEGEISVKIDYNKFEKDSKWDGLKGYLTNTKLPALQVIENYNNLWHIERAFRISKTDLKIRPIYHRIRERIEAHICISFISYVLYKELDRMLKEKKSKLSMLKAIEQINKMYGVELRDNNGNAQLIKLKNNDTQQEIQSIVTSQT
jgi:transposase